MPIKNNTKENFLNKLTKRRLESYQSWHFQKFLGSRAITATLAGPIPEWHINNWGAFSKTIHIIERDIKIHELQKKEIGYNYSNVKLHFGDYFQTIIKLLRDRKIKSNNILIDFDSTNTLNTMIENNLLDDLTETLFLCKNKRIVLNITYSRRGDSAKIKKDIINKINSLCSSLGIIYDRGEDNYKEYMQTPMGNAWWCIEL